MKIIKATADEITVLGALCIYPNGALISEIAPLTKFSYQEIYRMMQRLIKNNLVIREREAEGIIFYPTFNILEEEWEAVL